MRVILLILPISILVFNYTMSKLESDQRIGLSSYMLIFLVIYTLYIGYQNLKYFHIREVRYVLLFLCLSVPAYLMSSFTSQDSYIRYLALLVFVPLGFITGLVIGKQFSLIEGKGGDLIITVLMIPAFIVIYLFIQTSGGLLFEVGHRDFVFGMIIFLPLLLYYRNGTLQVIVLFILSFFCLISAKRTGIISVVALIPFVVLTRMKTEKKNVLKTIIPIILFISIAYVVSEYLPELSPQLDYARSRFDDIEEDRMNLYAQSIQAVESSSLFNFLFGHGCLATVEMYGKPTHNDWLEIIYDYGFLPFLCIFSLVLSLLRRVVKAIKHNWKTSLILFSTMLNYLIVAMLNCMITNHWAVFILLFSMGFALSYLNNLSISK